jgi:hypothetical protein
MPAGFAKSIEVKAIPLLICAGYLLLLAAISPFHEIGAYGTETDFYQYYAPDSQRILQREFPQNTFQGPGYALALAGLSYFIGDIFAAGKWISIASGALVLFLCYLIFSEPFGHRPAIVSMLIVATSREFTQFSISATTDVFFLALCLLALYLRSGIFAAASYLTRYNGLFLLPAFLFGRKLSIGVLVSFLIVVSPWLWLNYQHHGSPLYNTNYLNAATQFYGKDNNLDGTTELAKWFYSWDAVLAHDPMRIVTGYFSNQGYHLRRMVTSDPLAPSIVLLAAIGLAQAWRNAKPINLLISAGIWYLLPLGLIHWEPRYFFFINILAAGFAAYCIFEIMEVSRPRYARQITAGLLFLIIGASGAMATVRVKQFLASEPLDLPAACGHLKSGSKIAARKPHIAFICGGQWALIPNLDSVDDLQRWLNENKIDYLVFGPMEVGTRARLIGIRERLKPVWKYNENVIYSVTS